MKWDGPIERRPTVSMDRFSQGRPDPQDAEPIAKCAQCGKPFHEGEDVYEVDGEVICATRDCLERYTGAHYTQLERPSHPRRKW
jgi:hypothetical protein